MSSFGEAGSSEDEYAGTGPKRRGGHKGAGSDDDDFFNELSTSKGSGGGGPAKPKAYNPYLLESSVRARVPRLALFPFRPASSPLYSFRPHLPPLSALSARFTGFRAGIVLFRDVCVFAMFFMCLHVCPYGIGDQKSKSSPTPAEADASIPIDALPGESSFFKDFGSKKGGKADTGKHSRLCAVALSFRGFSSPVVCVSLLANTRPFCTSPLR